MPVHVLRSKVPEPRGLVLIFVRYLSSSSDFAELSEEIDNMGFEICAYMAQRPLFCSLVSQEFVEQDQSFFFCSIHIIYDIS
jgi:hypothetical protein